jgi:N-acetyl-alpha-D-muramate 1-phosphate uridylyltransferase
MMSAAPNRAMVLAAGLGLRLRPITETIPKPLVDVGGRTLLDRSLDALEAASIETCVVNTHYLADQIERHLASRPRPRTIISHEPELLDTGGGVRKALPLLGDDPFVVVNSDTFWLDGITPMLDRLTRQWDPQRLDALLLLHPTVWAIGYDGDGRGDYLMDTEGHARRRIGGAMAPFLFAGVSICSRSLFAEAPTGAFSLRLLWDRAEEAGRLFGMRHDGEWFHIGTPEALEQARAYFERGGRQRRTME